MEIKINKLFNMFNYDISFENQVTILTGPNGYGKSTILKIISALNEGVEGIIFLNSIDYESVLIKITRTFVLCSKFSFNSF